MTSGAELHIDSLAYGGSGVGRLDGKAVFVPLTAPGDRILCRMVREKKHFAEGEATRILQPSSLRREPPCPVFGRCGGCQWQHLPYAGQREWKERIFADILHRQAKVPAASVLPLHPAPAEWNYRSRVQFKCRQTEQGLVIGFYRRGSHFVVDVEDCPITDARLNETLRFLRLHLPAAPGIGQIPQIDLGIDDHGRQRGVVHYLGSETETLLAFLGPLAQSRGLSLFLQTGRKETLRPVWGEEDLHLRVGSPPLDLAYGPGGFAQVNLAQNLALVEAVVQAAELRGGERVLDLFCGMGNFSLPLARCGAEVIGIEDFAPAIVKARQNADRNGLAGAVFRAAAVTPTLRRLRGESFDLVLLDPPRTGAYEEVKALLDLRPRRILYVSCDPPTLARDLLPLLHGGYLLRWSRPFDLFPQTFHTESLSLLEATDPR